MVGGNNGTPTNDVTFDTGEDCQAFRFNSTQAFTNPAMVYVGSAPNLQLQDFTIEAWIKRSSTSIVTADPSNGHLFGFGHLGYILGVFPSGVLFLSKVDVDSVSGGPAITDLNFHHVAVTKSGSTVFFYVDGTQYSAPSYDTFFSFTTGATIGGRIDNHIAGDNIHGSFLGMIDEVSVYNRALNAKEIQSLYNAGAAGKCKPPLLQRFYQVIESP
jgi:hypothetical protein